MLCYSLKIESNRPLLFSSSVYSFAPAIAIGARRGAARFAVGGLQTSTCSHVLFVLFSKHTRPVQRRDNY